MPEWTEPSVDDLEHLAKTSAFGEWVYRDAWLWLRENEPHDGRRKALWDAMCMLRQYVHPREAVVLLFLVMYRERP